jgi:hypothetical protein
VAAALALIFLLACSGTALARSVSIGHGRTIYLECRGHGGPTVVLISGLGDRADIWDTAALAGPSSWAAADRVKRGAARVAEAQAILHEDYPGDRHRRLDGERQQRLRGVRR